MEKIEVDYAIQRDGDVIFEECAVIDLTDADIKEIADYILADEQHQTAELMDIPERIYDYILDKVSEDALQKTNNGIRESDDIGLMTYLPVSLVELLPDEVIDTFPDELFSDNPDDEDFMDYEA